MAPEGDGEEDPPSSREAERSRWLAAYVAHRWAELRRAEEDAEAPSESEARVPEPPPITAADLAPYLAELARRYRQGGTPGSDGE